MLCRTSWYARLALLVAATLVVRADAADANSLNARGIELERVGRYGEAEQSFQDALGSCRKISCSLLPAILTNLGSLYYVMVRYRDAEPVLKEAISIDSDSLASALANLAAVYRAEARYTEAAPLYERALKLRGADPELQAKLALLLQDVGDSARAEKMIREATAAFESRGSIETADGANLLTDLAA